VKSSQGLRSAALSIAFVALVALVPVSVGACGSGTTASSFLPHPSDQAARADLAKLVTLAAAGDYTGLCAHGSLNCMQNFKDFTAGDTVPSTAPIVVGSWDVPDQGQKQGGRLLEVCGLNGDGKAYRSSHLFYGLDDQFTVIEALYWVPIDFISGDIISGTAEPSRASEWSVCPSGA
jgi:hypothetical protein